MSFRPGESQSKGIPFLICARTFDERFKPTNALSTASVSAPESGAVRRCTLLPGRRESAPAANAADGSVADNPDQRWRYAVHEDPDPRVTM